MSWAAVSAGPHRWRFHRAQIHVYPELSVGSYAKRPLSPGCDLVPVPAPRAGDDDGWRREAAAASLGMATDTPLELLNGEAEHLGQLEYADELE